MTGRGKRAIEDHFDRSFELEENLKGNGKAQLLKDIRRISELANFCYVRQSQALGLGHAVLCAQHLMGNEPFAVILGGLTGAIVWDLVTWWLGLPTSSSHALVGGYAGAAVAKAGFSAILASGWTKTLIFIVVAPLMGFVLALLLTVAFSWSLRRSLPRKTKRRKRRSRKNPPRRPAPLHRRHHPPAPSPRWLPPR